MKLGGGFYIWTIIAVLFFRWVQRNDATLRPGDDAIIREPVLTPDDSSTVDNADSDLTFEAVQSAFERAGEPITEGVKRDS